MLGWPELILDPLFLSMSGIVDIEDNFNLNSLDFEFLSVRFFNLAMISILSTSTRTTQSPRVMKPDLLGSFNNTSTQFKKYAIKIFYNNLI